MGDHPTLSSSWFSDISQGVRFHVDTLQVQLDDPKPRLMNITGIRSQSKVKSPSGCWFGGHSPIWSVPLESPMEMIELLAPVCLRQVVDLRSSMRIFFSILCPSTGSRKLQFPCM